MSSDVLSMSSGVLDGINIYPRGEGKSPSSSGAQVLKRPRGGGPPTDPPVRSLSSASSSSSSSSVSSPGRVSAKRIYISMTWPKPSMMELGVLPTDTIEEVLKKIKKSFERKQGTGNPFAPYNMRQHFTLWYYIADDTDKDIRGFVEMEMDMQLSRYKDLSAATTNSTMQDDGSGSNGTLVLYMIRRSLDEVWDTSAPNSPVIPPLPAQSCTRCTATATANGRSRSRSSSSSSSTHTHITAAEYEAAQQRSATSEISSSTPSVRTRGGRASMPPPGAGGSTDPSGSNMEISLSVESPSRVHKRLRRNNTVTEAEADEDEDEELLKESTPRLWGASPFHVFSSDDEGEATSLEFTIVSATNDLSRSEATCPYSKVYFTKAMQCNCTHRLDFLSLQQMLAIGKKKLKPNTNMNHVSVQCTIYGCDKLWTNKAVEDIPFQQRVNLAVIGFQQEDNAKSKSITNGKGGTAIEIIELSDDDVDDVDDAAFPSERDEYSRDREGSTDCDNDTTATGMVLRDQEHNDERFRIWEVASEKIIRQVNVFKAQQGLVSCQSWHGKDDSQIRNDIKSFLTEKFLFQYGLGLGNDRSWKIVKEAVTRLEEYLYYSNETLEDYQNIDLVDDVLKNIFN